MPIFEYVCRNCGKRFERLVLSPGRARKVRCPHCDSSAVDKAISRFGTSGSRTGGSAVRCAPSG